MPWPPAKRARHDGKRSMKKEPGDTHEQVQRKISELYADLFHHEGFGKITVEMRFLRRGQKEIIVSSGKECRFVLDWP